MAMERFENEYATKADPIGCFVYAQSGNLFIVKASDALRGKWYSVNFDSGEIEPLMQPAN